MADNKKKKRPTPPKLSPYWIISLVILVLVIANYKSASIFGSTKTITLSEFESYLRDGDIEKVTVVNKRNARVFLRENDSVLSKHSKEIKESSPIGIQQSKKADYNLEIGDLQNFENGFRKSKEKYKFATTIAYITEEDPSVYFLTYLPFIILIGIWIFIMRRMGGGSGGGPGGQIFNIGKSKAKLFDENSNVKVTFKDVAGQEGAKEEVEEVVDFLKNPEKYTSLGGKIPRGVLLVGPPGTGKTLLAKAVAGEAKVPFFSLSGSDFVEMFVGVGASRVRDLFKQAKDKSPAIIFIDEIDAIGRARGKNNFSGSNDERENTLNQLLTEMDGFGTQTNVIVIGATNRADILDNALMRAGRFDRQIYVDLPGLKERQEIFGVHLKPLKINKEEIKVDFLAKQTAGFSGADIANLCNEAALIAARKDNKEVKKQDFLDAIDRIIGGVEKKHKVFTPEEQKIIAYHEAGHATASWFLEHANPFIKVTIVPRGKSLGAAHYLNPESQLMQTEKFLDDICVTMGGRAAEKIFFNKISNGAGQDLQDVTRKAKYMTLMCGMSEKLGNVAYYDPQQDNGFTKPYSEQTGRIIDEEIKNIIEQQYQRAIDILTEKKDLTEKLAKRLIEREVLFRDDLEEILGKSPFANHQKEIQEKDKNKIENTEKEEITSSTEDTTPSQTTTPETQQTSLEKE